MKKVAPPNSYIHAEWFEKPKDLVDYLNYLDHNETAYLEYHSWKSLFKETKNVKVLQDLNTDDRSICELCRLIRNYRRKKELVFDKHKKTEFVFKIYKLVANGDPIYSKYGRS